MLIYSKINLSFADWFFNRKDYYANLLLEFVKINSSSPNEHLIWPLLSECLTNRGFKVAKQPISSKIWNHPHHCTRYLSRISDESFNVLAKHDFGREETVLINCHIDVVPPATKGMSAVPKIADGKVYGRGSCDTKNNLILLLGSLDYLQSREILPNKNIILHLPIEEEIGGNGTLSLALENVEDIDCAVVLEPTNLEVFRGHRGCLMFDIEIRGKAVHMGRPHQGADAIGIGIKVIEKLKILERELISQAYDPGFAKWANPLQINIGKVRGGEWHGSVPEVFELSGNFGFLPHMSIETSMEMVRSIVTACVRELNGEVQFHFRGLKNEAYLMPAEEKIVTDLLRACALHGISQPGVFGWNVSCDARIYYKELKVPTVIFGCGHLENAHSQDEHISINELGRGMQIFAEYFLRE